MLSILHNAVRLIDELAEEEERVGVRRLVGRVRRRVVVGVLSHLELVASTHQRVAFEEQLVQAILAELFALVCVPIELSEKAANAYGENDDRQLNQ